jgi:hypothetical protein
MESADSWVTALLATQVVLVLMRLVTTSSTLVNFNNSRQDPNLG